MENEENELMVKAEFEASLPNIQSALKFGDGMTRVQIDIPVIYKHEAKKFLDMDNKILRVTVEYEKDHA